MDHKGKFIISLDFELLWGMRDKKTISDYGTSIVGVREVIPRLLKLFKSYDINATFACVGMLFAKNKKELFMALPNNKPQYVNANFSPYNGYLETIGDNELEDPYHFASSFIELIKAETNHEIGTHTFSHYFCLEEGQTTEEFSEDLEAAKRIATTQNISLESIVFPRNQYTKDYLKVCKDLKIKSFRGNEASFYYRPTNGKGDTPIKRALRLIDTYISISGHNTYKLPQNSSDWPLNLPSSRFLRPHNPKLKWLEGPRLNRILKSMTHAAKNNEVYHLWWHPHNFGLHQTENFSVLETILKHYQVLNSKYGFQSKTMASISDSILSENV